MTNFLLTNTDGNGKMWSDKKVKGCLQATPKNHELCWTHSFVDFVYKTNATVSYTSISKHDFFVRRISRIDVSKHDAVKSSQIDVHSISKNDIVKPSCIDVYSIPKNARDCQTFLGMLFFHKSPLQRRVRRF